MKTLILCVDRDDDLGRKGGLQTPIVGRRRNLDGAMALGVADPEDSDVNALLSAIHLYDRELKAAEGTGDQVEVAVIAGHHSLGMQADRKFAKELDEVLALVRPDECILVSDGAEDEQIMPILQGRVRIAHVHRCVVKQAPRLEGFYYVLTRILDDEKQAKRFVLPFGIILLIWGLAYLLGVQDYAWGATLAVAGFWLVVQAMKWEEKVGQFFRDFSHGMRSGKVVLVATLAMLVLAGFGAIQAWGAMQAWPEAEENLGKGTPTQSFEILLFTEAFLPYLVSGLLLRSAGVLFDSWARTGRTRIADWSAAFSIIALYLVLGAVIGIWIGYLDHDPVRDIVSFARVAQVVAGVAIATGGTLVARYIRSFNRKPRFEAR